MRANDITALGAEHDFGGRIERLDVPVVREGDDALRRRMQNCAQAPLALLPRGDLRCEVFVRAFEIPRGARGQLRESHDECGRTGDHDADQEDEHWQRGTSAGDRV